MPIIPQTTSKPKIIVTGEPPTIRHLAAIYKSAWEEKGLAPRYFTQQELFMNKALLASLGSVDQLRLIIRTYLTLDDPWYKSNGYPLGLLMRAHPTIMAKLEGLERDTKRDFGAQEQEL
jgi:hypothetical protein